ncbi:YhdP family protein [Povalibacter sp.]|uniref:YhdP family protein n=1 Tax=Povalibacter sp. TaxID=1962978 RepID=UPI002F41598E
MSLFSRSKPLKYSLITLAVVIVLLGLLMGAFQIAVSRVPEYRVQLQQWVNDKTGFVIEFSRIGARLRRYGPELVFYDATVRTADRTRVLATARRGSVGFDLWTSMSERRLTAGRFTLDSPEIALIRTLDGRVRLLGQSSLNEGQGTKTIAVESLPVGQFRVRNAVVSFRDEITGRGPWSLSGISFTLSRQRALLELEGSASLPRTLGESLEFSARVAGDLGSVESLASSFAVHGEGLDLAGWADVMPNQWLAPETGHGSIDMSVSFRGAHADAVTARVDLAHVSATAPEWIIPLPGPDPLQPLDDHDAECEASACDAGDDATPDDKTGEQSADTTGVKLPAAPSLVAFDRLAMNFAAARHADTWEASVTDLDISRKSAPWQAQKIVAKWSQTDVGAMSIAVNADRLVLENLWPLLAYLPESEASAHLRALQARGTITNLALTVATTQRDASLAYEVKADLTDVGVRPVRRMPGISGVTAHIEGDEGNGTAHLDSRQLGFELPRMFRTPLAAQSAQGDVRWQRIPEGWRIASDELRVVTDDGNAQGRIAVTVPQDKSSLVLDLEATGDDLRVASTAKYLPANKLSPKALAWLDQAFVDGRVRDAHVSFKGPTRAVPFRNGEGEFLARGRIEGGVLNYQSGWQPARELGSHFEFRNEGMKVLTGTADVGGLRISQINATFADFKKGVLVVAAQADGELGHALALLQHSPLREALGEQFNGLRGSGAVHGDVSLHLPLKRIANRRILVKTRVSDATVESDLLAAPITSLRGVLTVRQALPESADLQGTWLNGPLQVSIEPVAARTQTAQLTATGRASAEQLTAALKLPSSVKVSGAADWRLSTQLIAQTGDEPRRQQPRKFVLDSDLSGFGIALPYPVGKSEAESRALRAEIEFDGDDELLLRSSLGPVRALLRLSKYAGGWQFDRGGVRADDIAAALPPHPGLRIEGSLDRLVLDDWFAVRGDTPGKTRVSDILRAANLKVGTLQLFGYQFPEVRGMLQAGNDAWKIAVSGPNAAGELTIPEEFTGSQPLTARLDHLVISRENKQSTPSGGRDPRSWPNLRAFVQDFRYEDHSIGSIDLQASRVPMGIRVDSLTIVQAALRGEVQAQWLVTPDGERSQMSASVVSTDVGATLRALNYTPVVEARHGEITAQLSWPGGFDSDFPGRASGTVTVAAEDGQLLSVQPGAGRMLGLFSVAALPRRLSLDFSDLTGEGLSFDKVHGDFELRDGNAYTNNLLLSGPAVEIGIAGRTGLGIHDYDQTAVVTGNLGASLPVAGALAGGPAVGAALLLFSQVFKEPLKGMTRGYYRITGPWDNPVVERVDAAQGKEAANSAREGASM